MTTIEQAKNKILSTHKGYVIDKIVDFNSEFYVALAYERGTKLPDQIDPYLKVNKKNGIVSDFTPFEDIERFAELFGDEDYDYSDDKDISLSHAADFIAEALEDEDHF